MISNLAFIDLFLSAKWFEYQGSCYTMPSLQNITYQTSVSECSALGSYLAEVNTLEELSYIQVLANGSSSSFWLGLNFNNGSGKFHWNRAGTEPMTGMWIDGEPNLTGLCVRLTTEVLMGAPTATPKDIYLLADNPCSSLYMSLCEKSAGSFN
nr:low affinity immunoglobulin epsilon Fc receptor-like [Biomphalaria glabrata]